MTTETKRDLVADLALCEKATAGPWSEHTNRHPELGGQPWGWLNAKGGAQIGTWSGSRNRNYDGDNRFITEAREGWPHAIRRAIKAERLLRDIGTLSLISDITEDDDDFYRFLERVEDAATFAKEQINSDNHELCEYCGLEFERGTTTHDKLCKVCAEKEDIEYEEAEWRDLVEDDVELRSSYLEYCGTTDDYEEEPERDDPAYYS